MACSRGGAKQQFKQYEPKEAVIEVLQGNIHVLQAWEEGLDGLVSGPPSLGIYPLVVWTEGFHSMLSLGLLSSCSFQSS